MSGGEAGELFKTGEAIGRWVVQDCISPGQPTVYRCHRADDDTQVALVKMMPKDAAFMEQARREVRILRNLDHPSIPRVIDFGLLRDRGVWVASNSFDGYTLADQLRDGPLDWREACRLFHQLSQALAHIHENAVVHQDVNPNKILLGDERVQLVGFECALDANEAQATTVPLGTISYLAPEVITEGETPGPRADLYALGVVFYEALTGRPAFPAALVDDQTEIKERMREWKTRANPLDPGEGFPKWLANLIRQATHPDPRERLPDMDAFHGWLDAASASWALEPTAPPAPVAAPPPLVPPPMLSVAAPSIAPPAALPAPLPPPQRGLSDGMVRPLIHLAAAALGIIFGFGFAMVVIVLIDSEYLL